MKKTIIIAVLSIPFIIFAGPHHLPARHIPPPPPSHHGHHHGSHHSSEIFWGVAGGLALGSLVTSAISPKPVVITPAPVVVRPVQVWIPEHVETRYVNGIMTTVVVPGHYEYR